MPGVNRARSLVCGNKEHTSVVATGSVGSFRHSPRNGFNGLLRALPGVHDLLVTVIGAMQSIVANLTPAKGRQDHTTWFQGVLWRRNPLVLLLFLGCWS